MRLAVIQHGDYAAAYHRLRQGGAETFRDQRHTVTFVASLAPEHEVVTIAACDRVHRETLAPSLHSIGVPSDFLRNGAVGRLLGELAPQRVILRTPSEPALRWLARRRVPVLPAFADTFSVGTVLERAKRLRLGAQLALARWPCVTNHGLSASLSVRNLLVDEARIVPRDNERLEPIDAAKEGPSREGPFRLFFAGAVTEQKGIGDAIEALARIDRRTSRRVRLSVAGRGDVERFRALAERLGVGASVEFLGVVPTARVLEEMRSHDAVLVPSRHDYEEGTPNVLFEGLASRTPLVVSDHPAFRDRFVDGRDLLVFRAPDPEDLARQVLRLLEEPDLYRRLSEHGEHALSRLYVGTPWSELVTLFLDDPFDRTGWVAPRSLGALRRRGIA